MRDKTKKLTKAQLNACDELLQHMNKKYPDRYMYGAGYFQEDVFSDGGILIAKIPDLSNRKANEVKEQIPEEIVNFSKNIDDDFFAFAPSLIIQSEDLKQFPKAEKYVSVSVDGVKYGISLYHLRRILILAQGKIGIKYSSSSPSLPLFQNGIGNDSVLIRPFIFKSIVNKVSGFLAPVCSIYDLPELIGHKIKA